MKGSTRQRFGSAGEGSTVSCHRVNYEVEAKIDGKYGKKTILKDISGVFRPGMNAILGPTGSGKTSLLDILAARKEPKGISGSVLIDGKSLPKNFKLVSGYVVQDDVVMGTLTVRENLAFSAALRLPDTLSKEERESRVDDVVKELGLGQCADTKVGTEFIRGVSGGERKRTNIGMELIIKPSVLFLDEPTTGLDASTANAVMHLLARLSRRGRSIIFSIHQPRYKIYRLFDTLHLLSLGETVYHGPVCEALEYFSSIGFVCQPHNNPPDFFLYVINEESSAVNLALDDTKEDVVIQRTSYAKPLAEEYFKSRHSTLLQDEARQILKGIPTKEESKIQEQIITYPCSFPKQLSHVSRRAVLNIIRNPFLTVAGTVIVIILSAIIGGIYFQLDNSIEFGIQNRIGAFFFLIMQQIFSNMSAVELFIQERVIFVHESASGFYRVSTYFFAKCVCDLLPLRTIPTIFYCTISYWMIGLRPEAGPFFFYTLNLLLTTYTATAMAFVVSSSVSMAAIGTLVIAICYVLMMVFSGLLVNINSLPVWLRWLQYLSIFRYSQNALAINELSGMEFCSKNADPLNVTCTDGNVYLERQGIDYSTWGLWQNEVALFSMTLGFLFLAYIQLRRIPKLK
ncbi:ATP-binding cassette sub-family G member 2 [Holothuria leucospilota]|uniref:ATP-binding cassette sub-family G member 2 n=1 Tax=Holothuria leucospilota TaxID=206669 RepID=A0A9Q0YHB7_HOLLE|nr:ATP-binding cassette sub-family G member 2 [Holothuria leucospilota]